MGAAGAAMDDSGIGTDPASSTGGSNGAAEGTAAIHKEHVGSKVLSTAKAITGEFNPTNWKL